jgi:hypothetical protein
VPLLLQLLWRLLWLTSAPLLLRLIPVGEVASQSQCWMAQDHQRLTLPLLLPLLLLLHLDLSCVPAAAGLPSRCQLWQQPTLLT